MSYERILEDGSVAHACTVDDIHNLDYLISDRCLRCGYKQDAPVCCPVCGWCEFGATLGCPDCSERKDNG